jgi:hypothetical protein
MLLKKKKAKEHKMKSDLKKRITTVPQFESTKKLMEENDKVVSLVSQQ